MPSEFFFFTFYFIALIKFIRALHFNVFHRFSIESQQKGSMEYNQKMAKHENADKENKSIDVYKVIADDIDEGAWYVCNKVWNLLDCPINESNDLSLNERLADIQVNHLILFFHSLLILNKN